jgi:DNA-binding protein WhiA
LLTKQSCKRGFLRCAFLGGGSISRPSSDYHLEMVTGNEDFARSIIKVMHTFSMKAKLTDRKNDYIVYLKDGESITNFLRVIGAHNSMMELENARVLKEMRNNVNRRVNCETANLGKVGKAAVRQVNCIKFIDEHMGLSELPEALQQTALLRLEYPEASLNELVEYSGDIGKSGINHRLKKLQEMAIGLGMEVEKD